MSADNWAICPKCTIAKENKREVLKKRLETDYGKVSVTEYKEMIENLKIIDGKIANPTQDSITLREDYEIGIDETGEFYVNYQAFCMTCNFEHIYKNTYTIIL